MDRRPLGQVHVSPRRLLDPVDRPPPPEDRRHIPSRPGFLQGLGHEAVHPRVLGEVGVDERGGFKLADSQPRGQPERFDPINHAEVDRLGHSPLVVVDLGFGHLEDLRGDGGMDVDVFPEGADQRGVLGIVREDTQLDLRIVGRDHTPPRETGDERLTDLTAVIGLDRDILQVGVG